MTDLFAQYRPGDVRDLITEFPLAWLCAAGGRAELAAHLPLLGEYDGDGVLTHLLGHIPRRHPLVPAWQADARVLVLFTGPQAYISPEQAGVSNWAPTWNFAQLSIEGELTLLPDATGAALTALVDAMEAGRDQPWSISALGERYDGMEKRVIAFRVRVTRVVGRFKLGQDERHEVLAAIIRSLGATPLARWMQRFQERRAV